MNNKLRLEKTKKGLPAAWECGGGATNTGNATIVAGRGGEALTPLYIRTRGDLSNGQHALFVVGEGTVIVQADHHRGDFNISVMRITAIATEQCGYSGEAANLAASTTPRLTAPEHSCPWCGGKSWVIAPAPGAENWPFPLKGEYWTCAAEIPAARTETIARYSEGQWDNEEIAEKFLAAIEAAKAKASCYHCRSPFYTKEAATK